MKNILRKMKKYKIMLIYIFMVNTLLIFKTYANVVLSASNVIHGESNVQITLDELFTSTSALSSTLDSLRNQCPPETTCVTVRDFATDSWSEIQYYAATNPISYPIGSTKCVKVNGFTGPSANGCSNGEFKVRVANNTRPSECNGGDFSQTACGFVVEFADVITTSQMNTSSTNVNGWPVTAMRTFVNGTIYNALPEDLRNAIVETTVVSGHGSTSGESNFKSTDKLYLLAVREVWSDKYDYDSAYDNTRQLDYYAKLGVVSNDSAKRQAAIKKESSNSARAWWLRTAASYNTSGFYDVCPDGSICNWNATSVYGVSPAFRIG